MAVAPILARSASPADPARDTVAVAPQHILAADSAYGLLVCRALHAAVSHMGEGVSRPSLYREPQPHPQLFPRRVMAQGQAANLFLRQELVLARRPASLVDRAGRTAAVQPRPTPDARRMLRHTQSTNEQGSSATPARNVSRDASGSSYSDRRRIPCATPVFVRQAATATGLYRLLPHASGVT